MHHDTQIAFASDFPATLDSDTATQIAAVVAYAETYADRDPVRAWNAMRACVYAGDGNATARRELARLYAEAIGRGNVARA
jgi:hypothetical protein